MVTGITCLVLIRSRRQSPFLTMPRNYDVSAQITDDRLGNFPSVRPGYLFAAKEIKIIEEERWPFFFFSFSFSFSLTLFCYILLVEVYILLVQFLIHMRPWVTFYRFYALQRIKQHSHRITIDNVLLFSHCTS